MNIRQIAFRGEFSAPTCAATSTPFAQVGPVIGRLSRALLQRQRADGSWREPACGSITTLADVLVLFAFLDRDDPRRPRLTQTLRSRQLPDGGWAGCPGGSSDLDPTVRAYLALKLNAPEASRPLERARERLAAWGAGQCEPRTRLLLALFGQLPHDNWATLPTNSPAEACALQVIDARKPVRAIPRDAVLAHLFRDEFRRPVGGAWSPLRLWNAHRAGEQLQRSLIAADSPEAGGPTSILPLIALNCLGQRASDTAVQAAWQILDEYIVDDDIAPALSPLRDTALALAALREAGMAADAAPVAAASEWLWARLVGGQARGNLTVDEAALVLIALAKSGFAFHGDRPTLIDHVLHSIFDEQDDDGGWGSPERTGTVLDALGQFGIVVNEPVVADAIRYLETSPEEHSAAHLHGAWRMLAGLRAVQHDLNSPLVRRAAAWLKRTQHAGGGWGDGDPAAAPTAGALLALMAAGNANSPEVDAGVDWLLNSVGESFNESACALMALGQFERHAAGWNS